MRNRLVLVAVGLLATFGCDERAEVELTEPAQPVNAATQSADQQTPPTTGPTQPIPLGVIPFRAEVPQLWGIQSSLGNRIVLHGTLETGEVDVLLSTQPALNPETFKNLIAGMKQPTTQPGGASTRVLERDGMTIVETVERPMEGLVKYTVRYFVTGPSLDYSVYEASIGDLTQEMFEKDGETIRTVLLGLKYDPTATELPR